MLCAQAIVPKPSAHLHGFLCSPHSANLPTYAHTYVRTQPHQQAYRHAKIREAIVVDSFDHPEYDAWVGGAQVRWRGGGIKLGMP